MTRSGHGAAIALTYLRQRGYHDPSQGRALVTHRRSEHASFVQASIQILRVLEDGEWHRSEREIHEPLRPWVKEYMFGKVKSRFGIECRQVGGGPG